MLVDLRRNPGGLDCDANRIDPTHLFTRWWRTPKRYVGDSETAFLAFYTHLLAGGSMEEAVERMRIGSGDRNFVLQYGHQTTGPFIRLMKNLRDGRLDEVLRERYRTHWEAIPEER